MIVWRIDLMQMDGMFGRAYSVALISVDQGKRIGEMDEQSQA